MVFAVAQVKQRNLSRGVELRLPLSVVEKYAVKLYPENTDSITRAKLYDALEREMGR